MFSQHYPFKTEWGPMHWGHADSADLLSWRRLPVAIAPSEPYDLEMGCWSGSAADDGGTLRLVYTAASGAKAETQAVCTAWAPNGLGFAKSPRNPVIAGPPAGFTKDFRDPRVFRYGDSWRLVVGGSREGRGCVLLYESADFESWRHLGVLAESDGSWGHMWECPDLFPLGDRWVLVVSPMGVPGDGSRALIGRLEEDGKRFVIEEAQNLDLGPDFYAPQTMEGPDGRRILIGWMDHWKSPEPPTVAAGWRGAMTLPRVLRPGPGGKGLSIEPVEELAAWHGEELDLSPGGRCRAGAAEIEASLPGGGPGLELTLMGSADGSRGVFLSWNGGTGELEIDPSRSGPASRKPFRIKVPVEGGRAALRVVADRSSVEVFAGNPPSRAASCLAFPAPGDDFISARASGAGPGAVRLRGFRLAPPRLPGPA
jgi:beta-fructofuranosidase